MAPTALVQRLYDECVNQHDAVAAAALYREAAVNHGRVVGREGMQRVFESLFATFPDIRYEILNMTAEADRVAATVRVTGTHEGEPTIAEMFQGMLRNVAPTGKRMSVLQSHEFRFENGLIAEHEAVRDDLGMLLQLGVVARDTDQEGASPDRAPARS